MESLSHYRTTIYRGLIATFLLVLLVSFQNCAKGLEKRDESLLVNLHAYRATAMVINKPGSTFAGTSYLQFTNKNAENIVLTGELFDFDGNQVGTSQTLHPRLSAYSSYTLNTETLVAAFGNWSTPSAVLYIYSNLPVHLNHYVKNSNNNIVDYSSILESNDLFSKPISLSEVVIDAFNQDAVATFLFFHNPLDRPLSQGSLTLTMYGRDGFVYGSFDLPEIGPKQTLIYTGAIEDPDFRNLNSEFGEHRYGGNLRVSSKQPMTPLKVMAQKVTVQGDEVNLTAVAQPIAEVNQFEFDYIPGQANATEYNIVRLTNTTNAIRSVNVTLFTESMGTFGIAGTQSIIMAANQTELIISKNSFGIGGPYLFAIDSLFGSWSGRGRIVISGEVEGIQVSNQLVHSTSQRIENFSCNTFNRTSSIIRPDSLVINGVQDFMTNLLVSNRSSTPQQAHFDAYNVSGALLFESLASNNLQGYESDSFLGTKCK
ncbi:MAG: hypothetical protein R2827_10940 [Bdellovibrionales bacterium]